jgi:hypothetical protein
VQIDWRGLFDEIGVEWIDRGKNTSAGNINVSCPWCLNDPSKHLAVALMKEAYYCFRAPNQHSGKKATNLLFKLKGIREPEALRLIRKYLRSGDAPIVARLPTDVQQQKTAWSRFENAGNSTEALEYLSARGFPSPRALCERFDLRYARNGGWARRLLIPFHHDGEAVSWTGRDMTGRYDPKYLTNETSGFAVLCTPDIVKPSPAIALIVEGPMDALRTAQATRDAKIISIALCGKSLGAEKLLQIRNACKTCTDILVTMDADAPMSACYQTVAEIQSAVTVERVGRAKLPPGVKDPGELPSEGVIQWVNEAYSIQRYGRKTVVS